MIAKVVGKIETIVGSGLVALAAAMLIESKACLMGPDFCGMVAPLYAIWGLLFGTCLVVAGLSWPGRKIYGVLGHIPLLLAIILLATLD
ncbi:MAG: hypothetical protein QNJ00_13810 [Woeseiaceae bacterium]|nr:hypothetical protein [Woeseiaceae bacterium]